MKLKIITILLFLCVTFVFSDIKRVEPAFWWTGMNEPSFQILVYGDEIGGCNVRIEEKGVTLERVERVENTNYLFLCLNVLPEATAGNINIRLEKAGQLVEEISYPLHERERDSAARQGFDNSDVLYLITPDRFSNGNPENDIVSSMNERIIDRGHPYARHGGDLQGIVDQLDYLADLGVTTLWLNPVLENNQTEFSYHGYSITDFYKVDPRFGSNELYRQLADEASKRGMKLIMDQVFNQCGSEHWWMKDLPSTDWINYIEDPKFTNHRRTTHQDPYAAQEEYELMTQGWFVSTMPDMNLRNQLFEDYLIQNSIWWVEYLGLAGIRQDTYCYPDKHALSRWCDRIMREYPNFNITGEEWSENPLVLSYWQDGKVNADGYDGHLPSLIDFPVRSALRNAFGGDDGEEGSLMELYEMLANDHVYPNASNNVTFMSNHDMPRFFMEIGQDPDWYKNALVFLATTRGIPQLYYGDEILLTHSGGNGHGFIRRDFPGGWQEDCVNGFLTDGLGQRETEAFNFTRKVLNWRKQAGVVHRGKLRHYSPENNVYVFFRYDEENLLMTILNKNSVPHQLDLSRFARILDGKTKLIDVLNDQSFELDKTLLLQPKQPYIFELL